MSLVSVLTQQTGSCNVVIGAGSGNGRYVVALATENHWDPAGHGTVATLDGVNGTPITISGGDPDGMKSQGWYWLDADLPAAGTYPVTLNGNDGNGRQLTTFYLENMVQLAPADPTALAINAYGGFSDTLTAEAGSCVIVGTCWNYTVGQTVTVGAGFTTVINADQSNGLHTHSYSESTLTFDHDFSAFETVVGVAFAIEPETGGGGGSVIPVILNHLMRH